MGGLFSQSIAKLDAVGREDTNSSARKAGNDAQSRPSLAALLGSNSRRGTVSGLQRRASPAERMSEKNIGAIEDEEFEEVRNTAAQSQIIVKKANYVTATQASSSSGR